MKISKVEKFKNGPAASDFDCYDCNELEAEYFVHDGRALCSECADKFIAELQSEQKEIDLSKIKAKSIRVFNQAFHMYFTENTAKSAAMYRETKYLLREFMEEPDIVQLEEQIKSCGCGDLVNCQYCQIQEGEYAL